MNDVQTELFANVQFDYHRKDDRLFLNIDGLNIGGAKIEISGASKPGQDSEALRVLTVLESTAQALRKAMYGNEGRGPTLEEIVES